jgi:hypothetical protein
MTRETPTSGAARDIGARAPQGNSGRSSASSTPHTPLTLELLEALKAVLKVTGAYVGEVAESPDSSLRPNTTEYFRKQFVAVTGPARAAISKAETPELSSMSGEGEAS